MFQFSLYLTQAREALARMSTQLVNYMKQQGIPPNRPVLKMADPMLNNSWSDKSPHLSTKMEHHKSLDDLLPRLPKYSNDTGERLIEISPLGSKRVVFAILKWQIPPFNANVMIDNIENQH